MDLNHDRWNISMSPFSLPSGASIIVIVCMVGVVWTIFTFIIRIFLRLKVNGPLGWDDVACGLATVWTVSPERSA